MKLEQDIDFIEKRLKEQEKEILSIHCRSEKGELSFNRRIELHLSAVTQYNYFKQLKKSLKQK